ncbi:phage protein NinX family protein [Achromobacter sp. AGC39]
MTTIATKDLEGTALDWAVAKASHGMRTQQIKANGPVHIVRMSGACDPLPYAPSTDWSQAGPIIERENISTRAPKTFWPRWSACIYVAGPRGMGMNGTHQMDGATPLVAAMRCYVASRLGETVEIPASIAR